MSNTIKSESGFTLEELMSHLDRLLTSGYGSYKMGLEAMANEADEIITTDVMSISKDENTKKIYLSELL